MKKQGSSKQPSSICGYYAFFDGPQWLSNEGETWQITPRNIREKPGQLQKGLGSRSLDYSPSVVQIEFLWQTY